MSALFRLLHWMPPVRRLQAERDALRGEHSSMQLKLRAASAEMGVLEEQCRVLQAERDRLSLRVTQTADYERQAAQLTVALAAGQDVTRERDRLAADHASLLEQRDAALAERDRLAREAASPHEQISGARAS